MKKLISIFLAMTFLCQNVAFCLPERDFTLRPPSHFNKPTEEFIKRQNERESEKDASATIEIFGDGGANIVNLKEGRGNILVTTKDRWIELAPETFYRTLRMLETEEDIGDNVLLLGAGNARREFFYPFEDAFKGRDLSQCELKVRAFDISEEPEEFAESKSELVEAGVFILYYPHIDLNSETGRQVLNNPEYINNTRLITMHGVLDYLTEESIGELFRLIKKIRPSAISIRLIPLNHFYWGRKSSDEALRAEIDSVIKVHKGDYELVEEDEFLSSISVLDISDTEKEERNLRIDYPATRLGQLDKLAAYLRMLGYEVTIESYSLTKGRVDIESLDPSKEQSIDSILIFAEAIGLVDADSAVQGQTTTKLSQGAGKGMPNAKQSADGRRRDEKGRYAQEDGKSGEAMDRILGDSDYRDKPFTVAEYRRLWRSIYGDELPSSTAYRDRDGALDKGWIVEAGKIGRSMSYRLTDEGRKVAMLVKAQPPTMPKRLSVSSWGNDQAENIGLLLDNLGVDRDGIILNMGSGTNPIAIADRPHIYNVDSETGELEAGLAATVKGAKFIRANFYDIGEVLGHVDPTRNIAGIVWYDLPSFIRGYADRYSIWGEAFRKIQEQIPKGATSETVKRLVGEEVERLAFLRQWSGLNPGGYFIIASSLYPLSPQINRTQRFLSFAKLIEDDLEEVIVVNREGSQVAVVFKKSKPSETSGFADIAAHINTTLDSISAKFYSILPNIEDRDGAIRDFHSHINHEIAGIRQNLSKANEDDLAIAVQVLEKVEAVLSDRIFSNITQANISTCETMLQHEAAVGISMVRILFEKPDDVEIFYSPKSKVVGIAREEFLGLARANTAFGLYMDSRSAVRKILSINEEVGGFLILFFTPNANLLSPEDGAVPTIWYPFNRHRTPLSASLNDSPLVSCAVLTHLAVLFDEQPEREIELMFAHEAEHPDWLYHPQTQWVKEGLAEVKCGRYVHYQEGKDWRVAGKLKEFVEEYGLEYTLELAYMRHTWETKTDCYLLSAINMMLLINRRLGLSDFVYYSELQDEYVTQARSLYEEFSKFPSQADRLNPEKVNSFVVDYFGFENWLAMAAYCDAHQKEFLDSFMTVHYYHEDRAPSLEELTPVLFNGAGLFEGDTLRDEEGLAEIQTGISGLSANEWPVVIVYSEDQRAVIERRIQIPRDGVFIIIENIDGPARFEFIDMAETYGVIIPVNALDRFEQAKKHLYAK